MVIDAHAHIYPDKIAVRAAQSIGAFYEGVAMHHPGSVGALLAAMDAGGIDQALVCSAAMRPELVASINDFIHSQAAAHPGRLLGLATLHPDMPHPEDELRRALDMGLLGVKVHNDMLKIAVDDTRMDGIFAACEGVCPVLLHMGDKRYHYDNPGQIPGILRRFPRLRLICAHMGGYSEWEEARRYLLHENVFVDCSSSFWWLGSEQMRELILAFGTERVLFGSDFPMWDPGEELALLRGLSLSQAQLDGILARNFEAVFRG